MDAGLACGTIDCSPFQVLKWCLRGRSPTPHLKMPVLTTEGMQAGFEEAAPRIYNLMH